MRESVDSQPTAVRYHNYITGQEVEKMHPFGFVGGGPAAIGQLGRLLLENSEILGYSGLVHGEPRDSNGFGELGGYQNEPNSDIRDFLLIARDLIESSKIPNWLEEILGRLMETEETKRLIEAEKSDKTVMLPEIAQFIGQFGQAILGAADSLKESGYDPEFLFDTKIKAIDYKVNPETGKFAWHYYDENGSLVMVTEEAVLATGGREREISNQYQNVVSGIDLIQEGDAYHQILFNLITNHRYKIAIAGNSHTAFTVVWKIIEYLKKNCSNHPAIKYPENNFILIANSETKLYFKPDEYIEADAEIINGRKYPPGTTVDQIDEDGICNRFSGVRPPYRDLALLLERRGVLRINREEVLRTNEESDVIVNCAGFEANHPTVKINGEEVALAKTAGQIDVDNTGRVYDKDGNPIFGLRAIGLGAGYRASEHDARQDGFNFYTHGPVAVAIAREFNEMLNLIVNHGVGIFRTASGDSTYRLAA
jgi:hypothetical protein